jgi:hypothetical protein
MHRDRTSPPLRTRPRVPRSPLTRHGGQSHAPRHPIRCLATPARGLNPQMTARRHRHLRAVAASQSPRPRECRTIGCPFPRQGAHGFCTVCEPVYHAAHELRERLLARRRAHLQAARPDLFAAMEPTLRDRLLAHIAAQGAHRGSQATVIELAGLEDFLAELRDLGLFEASAHDR